MKLLFTTQPGYGHFYPLVPLAEAARRGGHTVAFATSASFASAVEDAGFSSFAAGLDWTESEVERAFPEIASLTTVSGPQEVAWWLNEVWGAAAPRAMTPDLVSIVSSWEPDLLVHEQWELGGALAGELTGLPYAMHSQGLLMPPSLWQKVAGSALVELRRGLGLGPDRSLRWMHRHCYLDDVPPSLQVPHDLELVQRYRSAARHTAQQQLPAWVDELPARPTVYASLGTVFNAMPHVFESVLDALAEEPVNLVLVVGPSQDPASFGSRPEGVHVERFLPQTAMLAHCDVVITHAGYNTVAEALREGLPMLAIPLRVDQPINAERCMAEGLALVLLPEEAHPAAIRACLRELLENPRYRANAKRIQAEMEAMPPIEVAVERLEQLGGQGSPN